MNEQEHMERAARFLENLRARGLRLTAQRENLFKVVAGSLGEPTTVQEIWRKAAALDPSVGIATVYRTLNLAADMGLVNVIYLSEGRFTLETPMEKLLLMVFCRGCNASFPLENQEEKQAVVEGWLAEEGVELLPQSIAIAGLCEKCREEGSPPAEPFGPGPWGGRGRCAQRRRFRGGMGGGGS